nr:putative retrotransposon Ty1-copia subclass protein [Tanacetum cinerariifolium]
MDGAVHTFKACLVAKGFTQTYEVDYEETFSPVAYIRAIQILIAIAAFYDYEIWKIYVKIAFLNGHFPKKVYMMQPEDGASTPAEKQRMKNVPYALAVGSIMYAARCDMKRELMVSCYTDAGYLTDVDDLKSLTGYVFVLNEVPTIEEPITMYCDNTGAITITNDHGVTKGARHFRVKVYCLRETIDMGDVRIKKIDTYDNLADPFTKALAFPKHSELTRKIGLMPASSLM